MEIFIPATIADLSAAELTPRWGYASTPTLRQALSLPGESPDERALLASAAFDLACTDSVLRIGKTDAPRRRVVVSADVPAALYQEAAQAVLAPASAPQLLASAQLSAAEWEDRRAVPGALWLQPISWKYVSDFYLDEAAREELVARALLDPEQQTDIWYEFDEEPPLWFDICEREKMAYAWETL